MRTKINVGLIGFGMAGKAFHAPLIISIPEFNLKTIRETKPEHIAFIRETYPQAGIVTDAKEIINDPDIDLVIVATPNALHHAYAKQALLAGKHVVVEKPFTVTSGEAEELIAISMQMKKVLSVYQNRRWDSDYLTIKKIIEGRALGELHIMESSFERFRDIRLNSWKEELQPGTGLLYDLGSHLIDQSVCLFGLPSSVSCDMRVHRPKGKIVDYFRAELNYDTLKVILKADFLVREPGPRYVLSGNKGGFVKYGTDIQEETLKAGLFPFQESNWGAEPESIWGTLNTEMNGLHVIGKVESERGNYVAYYRNVCNAIQGKEELIVKPEQALITIQIIEHAIKSFEEKRVVNFKK